MNLTPRQKSVLDVLRTDYRKQGYAPTVREICEKLGLSGPAGVHRILKTLEEKGCLQSQPGKKRSFIPVDWKDEPFMPVAGRIAAGVPLDMWDQPDERIPVDPVFYGDSTCFALRVSGDSMTGAHIQDGDLAIIRPQPDVRSESIAAVMVESVIPEATLKIVRKRGRSLELHAANPAYPPLRFSGRAKRSVRIIGRYVGLVRKTG